MNSMVCEGWGALLRCGICLLALALPGLPRAESVALPSGVSEVRSLGGFTEYQLQNGLQVLLMPVAGYPQTRVHVIYRVGSRHEAAGEGGLAHLLEHLTFRGVAGLGDLGVALNGDAVNSNALTTFDRTEYANRFASDPARLARVLQIEAARMARARLDAEDFAKEKPIVLNEMALRLQSVEYQMQLALQAGMFRKHPYGRPVGGEVADIEGLDLQVLQRFYRRHYRPDNAVLVITGGFNPGAALASIWETFGAVARPPEPLVEQELAEPVQEAARVVLQHGPQTGLAVAYRVPGMGHADAAALMVLAQTFDSGLKRLERDGKMALSSTVGEMPVTRDPFMFGVAVRLAAWPSDSPVTRKALEEAQQRWVATFDSIFPGEAAVLEARDRLLAQWSSGLSDPEQAPGLLGTAVGAGDWRLSFRIVADLRRISRWAVSDVAWRYVRLKNRTTVFSVTDAGISDRTIREEQLSVMDRLFSNTVAIEQRQSGKALDGLLPGPVTAQLGLLAQDTVTLDRQVQRYILPSGLRLALMERDSPGGTVTAHLRFRWGTAEETVPLGGWRALQGGLIGLASAKWQGWQIARALDELRVDLKLASTPQQLDIVLSAPKESLLPALALAKDLVAEPVMEEAHLKILRQGAISALDVAGKVPGAGVLEQTRSHRQKALGLTPADPDYSLSNAEVLEVWRHLTLADARSFHQRYWSANDASAALVGHLPADAAAVLEQLFGGWKKPQVPAFQRALPIYAPEPGARFVEPGDGQGSAVVQFRQGLPLSRDDSDYWPMLLAGQLLIGGGGLDGGRILERLRQKEAISYVVEGGLEVPPEGNRSNLSIAATGAPSRAIQVEALIREELGRAAASGFSDEELAKAKLLLRAARERDLTRDRAVAAALVAQWDSRRGFEAARQEQEQALSAVTAEQVREALQRLVDPQAWVITVVGAPPSQR